MPSVLSSIRGYFNRSTDSASQVGGLDPKQLANISNALGIQIKKDENGRIYTLPPEAGMLSAGADDGIENFIHYWMNQAFVSLGDIEQIEAKRIERYNHYRLMIDNSTEARLALDTYADEVLSIGLNEENPVKITISKKDVQERVLDVLFKNKILTNSDKPTFERSEVRQLAKMGDRFYKFISPDGTDEIVIHKVRHPELIQLEYEPITQRTLAYTAGNVQSYQPWEFCHFKIHNADTEPYGESMLEPMRAAYQQLLINEALLALSRASRVERLVIGLPVTNKNPTAAFQTIMNIKSLIKNSIFGSTGTARSKSRPTALTDILFKPSGDDYSIDRLGSSIDVGGIDDVEFFRDKFLTASRLPKGYLLADDTFRVEAGTLAAQDVKFARALLPLHVGYAEGLTSMIMMLLIHMGEDPFSLDVKVEIKRPQALSSQVLEEIGTSLSISNGLVESYAMNVGIEQGQVDRKGYNTFLNRVAGIPESIVKLLDDMHGPESSEFALDKDADGPSSIFDDKIVVNGRDVLERIMDPVLVKEQDKKLTHFDEKVAYKDFKSRAKISPIKESFMNNVSQVL